MYPPVIQFETKQMELEALLGLYGEREALAHRALAQARVDGRRRRSRLLFHHGPRRRRARADGPPSAHSSPPSR